MTVLCCPGGLDGPSPSETITKRGHEARYPTPKLTTNLRPKEQLVQIGTNDGVSEGGQG